MPVRLHSEFQATAFWQEVKTQIDEWLSSDAGETFADVTIYLRPKPAAYAAERVAAFAESAPQDMAENIEANGFFPDVVREDLIQFGLHDATYYAESLAGHKEAEAAPIKQAWDEDWPDKEKYTEEYADDAEDYVAGMLIDELRLLQDDDESDE